MYIKIETAFNRTRAFVKVAEDLERYCNNFDDDDYFDLAEYQEIRCILEGDFTKLINSISNKGYYDINFSPSKYKIFIDKPNKNKSDDPIKNQFRIKIIKKEATCQEEK